MIGTYFGPMNIRMEDANLVKVRCPECGGTFLTNIKEQVCPISTCDAKELVILERDRVKE